MPLPPAPLVLDSSSRLGVTAAEIVANRLAARPRARLVLSAGRLPAAMFAALRARAAAGALDSAGATVLQLDEYAGLAQSDPRSLAARLERELDGVPLARLATIDGGAAELPAEADRHAAALAEDPIDLAVLALGRDGRVAFDEPYAEVREGVRVVELDADTRSEAAARLSDASLPERGITTGLRTLAEVRELVLLAGGSDRAEPLRRMLEEPVGPDSPASLLRDHPRLTVVCDREAASLLTPHPSAHSDRLIVVLGHRQPGVSAEHTISAESLARLYHAARLAHRGGARAVVLTGWTSTGGFSEAEQMKAAWDESLAPALLEEAGRNTAENAACSLPLAVALGAIRRVSVVTSAWHLRARPLFAPYRRFGFELDFSPTLSRGWVRGLKGELVAVPTVRAQRRAAMEGLYLPELPA